MIVVVAFSIFLALPVKADRLDSTLSHTYHSRQVELVPFGGSYLGSTVGQAWAAGGRGYYYFSDHMGIGAAYGLSHLYVGNESDFGSSLTNRWMHMVDTEMIIGNSAATKVGERIFPIDLFLTLGAGGMAINDKWEPMGLLGGGIRVVSSKWMAIRFDVTNYIHFTPHANWNPLDFDTAFLVGVSFFLPERAK